MKTLKISYAFYIFILLMVVSACAPENDNAAEDQSKIIIKPEDVSIAGLYKNSPEVNKDLKEIIEDGILKVVMTNSSTSYFVYRGQAMGYEFELLTRLADHLNLALEIIVANDSCSKSLSSPQS